MGIRMFKRILCLAMLALLPLTLGAADLDGVLANMDRAARNFTSMEAKITRLKYMALLDSKDTESGMIYVRRDNKGRVQMAIHFKEPYEYYLAVNRDKAEIYRPRIATVEEYNISKHRDTFQQGLLLGFGTTEKYLRDSYDMRLLGEDTVGDRPTVHLELIPKSDGTRRQVPKIELWVSTKTWQAVQQKPHQPGGEDYRIFTYDDVKQNVKLDDKVFNLSTPKGTKRVFPQR